MDDKEKLEFILLKNNYEFLLNIVDRITRDNNTLLLMLKDTEDRLKKFESDPIRYRQVMDHYEFTLAIKTGELPERSMEQFAKLWSERT